jgi:hypothetical protein
MITFTKDIATDKLLLAYVNNVVEFSSDNVLSKTKATISIGASIKTLFPSPIGTFYLNFKDWITSLINVDNFTDDLQADIIGSGYIYDWTSKAYLNNIITFTIFFSDESFETTTRDVKWLSAYLQLEDFKLKYPIGNSLLNPVVLSPRKLDANQTSYVKYWDGYPFDFTVYCANGSNLTILNQTNLLDLTFTNVDTINRIVISDGDTSTTIEGDLPLMNGFNRLKLTSSSLDYFLLLEKINDSCEGHYVKWINDSGGWSYWLFANGNRNRKAKDLGELNNDFSNLAGTISPTIQIGKASNDTITVTSDIINEDEKTLLESIIDSPKIYLFTGQPYSKANFNDWMELSLNTTDFRIVNAKEKLSKMNFVFELPQRNTRKL